MFCCCKLGSFSLILPLFVSHHFILLHCQSLRGPPPPEQGLYYSPPALPPKSPSPPLPELGNLLAPYPESPTLTLSPESPTLAPSPESPTAEIIVSKSIGLIAWAVIGLVVLISLVVLCTCICRWRSRRKRSRPSPQPPREVALSIAPPSPSIGLRLGPRKFTYEELVSATNGFSDSNFLGEGGFGVVHKGFLLNEQTCIAVKQLKYGIQNAQKEFLNEIRIINRIHHKYLVSLVGYCIDESHRKMMLVYEFVPNKTIGFHLHEKGSETIDWKTRMKIAIGSAKGLAYLHEECESIIVLGQPKIIHRDIKASNILVDDNFEPKVADFGLARLTLESQIITRIMGSFGYLAPEYAASGKLTTKSDVFSFGVVLLELITGQRPVGNPGTFPNGSLVEWATRLFSEALNNRNFEGIADARLQHDYEVEEMFRMVSCAANCIRYFDTSRPRMSQVVQALEGVICLDNDLTEENLARRQLSEDLSKLRTMAMGSFSTTTHSDQFHPTTSTFTSTFASAVSRFSSFSASKFLK